MMSPQKIAGSVHIIMTRNRLRLPALQSKSFQIPVEGTTKRSAVRLNQEQFPNSCKIVPIAQGPYVLFKTQIQGRCCRSAAVPNQRSVVSEVTRVPTMHVLDCCVPSDAWGLTTNVASKAGDDNLACKELSRFQPVQRAHRSVKYSDKRQADRAGSYLVLQRGHLEYTERRFLAIIDSPRVHQNMESSEQGGKQVYGFTYLFLSLAKEMPHIYLDHTLHSYSLLDSKKPPCRGTPFRRCLETTMTMYPPYESTPPI
ncbi:hypothetical protein IQ07DRAFT_382053 [Pyrenochaeta sp. DS3sAY3a]|nr:hypothetical protein IQ07DRAFT_382053 [Pyrenochaeta sp. DS3sAY3a]